MVVYISALLCLSKNHYIFIYLFDRELMFATAFLGGSQKTTVEVNSLSPPCRSQVLNSGFQAFCEHFTH